LLLDATWHPRAVSGKLELTTPVVVVAPPQQSVKFWASLPEKRTLVMRMLRFLLQGAQEVFILDNVTRGKL